MPVSFSWSVSTPSGPTPAVGAGAGGAAVAGADALRDLALDPVTGDLVLDETGDLVFNFGAAAIASDVASAWQTFLGEWFLDLSRGVNYIGLVFVKNPDLGGIERELRRVALVRDGVKDVELQLTFDRTARELSAAAQITPDYGEIFSLQFKVAEA